MPDASSRCYVHCTYTYSKNFFKFLLVQMHFSVTYLSSKFSEFSSCVIICQKSIILSTINPQLHFKKCWISF